jgi:hypothetical protein
MILDGPKLTVCSGSRVLGDSILVGASFVTRCLGDNMLENATDVNTNGMFSKH